MPKLRISIVGLMGFIVLIGVGFAALKNKSEPVASATFTATMAMLLLALVGVGFRRGEKQLFWTGFAVFGWGMLAFDLSTGALVPPRLFSSYLIVCLTQFMPMTEPSNLPLGGMHYSSMTISISNPLTTTNPFSIYPFFQIAHSLAIIMAALLGAMVVRIFATREDRQS
jgi:hypothetical protein